MASSAIAAPAASTTPTSSLKRSPAAGGALRPEQPPLHQARRVPALAWPPVPRLAAAAPSPRRAVAAPATAGTPGHLNPAELLEVALKAAEAGAEVRERERGRPLSCVHSRARPLPLAPRRPTLTLKKKKSISPRPPPVPPPHHLPQVVRAALDKPRTITFKGATDLVTETDGASEAAVLDVLRGAYPGHAILGEEGGVSGDTASDYLWCVDPLDGTTNFAHGYPSFAVSVAVLRRAVPVAGVVIEFAGGPGAWVTKTYAAARNGGATLNGAPISVSRTADVTRSLLVTGFGYEHDAAWEANLKLFRHFTDVSQGVRRLGAASVDMCHVALGVVDAYWEYRLKPWDVAAGVLIVEEAGGRVSTMDGLPYSVFQRSVLVSNDALHEALLEKTDAATAGLREAGVDLSPWFVPDGYGVHTGAQL